MEDINLEKANDNDFKQKLKELISNIDSLETESLKTDSFDDETETFDDKSLEITNDESENDELSLNRLVLNDEFESQSEDENLENEEEYLEEDEEANSLKEDSEYSSEDNGEYLDENLDQKNIDKDVIENENDTYIRQLNELQDEISKIKQLASDLTKSMKSEIIEMIYEKFSFLESELKRRLN